MPGVVYSVKICQYTKPEDPTLNNISRFFFNAMLVLLEPVLPPQSQVCQCQISVNHSLSIHRLLSRYHIHRC